MKWSDIPGWTCDDTRALYDERCGGGLDIDVPNAVIVEVGVAYGRSLAYLASIAPPSTRIVGVDVWRGHMGGDNLPPDVYAAMTAHGSALDACRANLKACGALDRVELIQAPSVEAAELFADHSCDLVFIDANHTLEALREDIAAWRSKVKHSGELAGHDYSWDQFPGVIQAVCEAFGMKKRRLDGVVWRVAGDQL